MKEATRKLINLHELKVFRTEGPIDHEMFTLVLSYTFYEDLEIFVGV